MTLPNETTVPEQTFYPFKRLPAELQCMIWRLTPEPRVVEIDYKETWKEDLDKLHPPEYWEQEGAYEEYEHYSTRVRYGSSTPLPVAFYVSSGARNALLSLYPYRFASETHGPGVRFNMSSDMLYAGELFGNFLFRLLECLTPDEAAGLEKFALARTINHMDSEDWTALGTGLEKISGLRDILIVHDIYKTLEKCYVRSRFASEEMGRNRFEEYIQEYEEVKKGKGVELLETFPQDLLERFRIHAEFILQTRDFSIRLFRSKDHWVHKKARHVWGSQRVDRPVHL